MKWKTRSKIIAFLWILVTAGMAILTENNQWPLTPLAIISGTILVILGVSILFDNL